MRRPWNRLLSSGIRVFNHFATSGCHHCISTIRIKRWTLETKDYLWFSCHRQKLCGRNISHDAWCDFFWHSHSYTFSTIYSKIAKSLENLMSPIFGWTGDLSRVRLHIACTWRYRWGDHDTNTCAFTLFINRPKLISLKAELYMFQVTNLSGFIRKSECLKNTGFTGRPLLVSWADASLVAKQTRQVWLMATS